MTDTTVDKTDPSKTAPKPGDKAVATPAKPVDEHAAGAQAALHSDATHPALAAKPSDAKPAAPPKSEAESLADKLHADLGWAFKTASADAKAVSATVSSDVKAVSSTVSSDIKAVSSTVSSDVKAVNSTVSSDVKAVNSTVSADAKALVADARSVMAPSTPPKDVPSAKPPTGKDAPVPPASTGLLASAESVYNSIANSTLGTVIGDVTGYSEVAAVASTAVGAGVALSTDAGALYDSLTSAASSAVSTFTNAFGTGADAQANFVHTAERVKSVESINFDDVSKLFTAGNSPAADKAKDSVVAAQAAKALGISWAVAGENTPGGTPTVSAEGGHEIGSGKNIDNVAVTTDVTQKSSDVKAPGIDGTVTKQGSKLDTADFTTLSNKDGIQTVYDKQNHETLLFNSKTHMVTVENPNNGTTETIKGGEVTTQINPQTSMSQVGDAGQAASAAMTAPDGSAAVQSRYFADSKGNMALVQSDGTVYKYDKKDNTLEVGKDGHWIKENFTNHQISYYTEDPKTHAKTELPKGSLPQGVTVAADGSITVKGKKIADAQGQILHLGDPGATAATYDTHTKTLTGTDSKGKSATLQAAADGSGTQLTDGGLNVKVPAKPVAGAEQISQDGKPTPLTYNAETGAYKLTHSNGASVEIGANGSVKQTTSEGTVGTIDPKGNENLTDNKGHLLANISCNGVVGLYDGTQFNPDGQIYNENTGFHETAYVPTAVDASDDNYDPSSSDNSSNGSSSDYSSSDGSSDNGYATQDASQDPNNPDNPNSQIEQYALQTGDVDLMDNTVFDKYENKIDSALDRLKAKWNFGKDLEENKDDKLLGREDTSELSKWMRDFEKGDVAAIPKEAKIKGLEQNLDIGAYERGNKDASTPGAANLGDIASLESLKGNMDAISLKLGIDTSYFDSQLTGMEQKIQKKAAAAQTLEEAGIAPTADKIKRMQDNGNTVIANQFGADERATA